MSKSKQIPYVIKTNGGISLFLNEEGVTINQDHPNYKKILEVLKTNDHSSIESLVNIAASVKKFMSSSNKVTVRDGLVS